MNTYVSQVIFWGQTLSLGVVSTASQLYKSITDTYASYTPIDCAPDNLKAIFHIVYNV